jgi:hypothetical protein
MQTKNVKFPTLLLVVSAWLFVDCDNAVALPKEGITRLQSPTNEYEIRLFDTEEQWTYKLTILSHGSEMSHYTFRGELISAYWSPSERYIAINNHYGRGWYLWIISLKDGSIIRSTGGNQSANYDRYTDYDYIPDITQLARTQIEQVYSGYSQDHTREGYTSVAYGWKTDDDLMMFHEMILGQLFEKERSAIHVYAVFDVNDQKKISVTDISAKKVPDQWWYYYPSEVGKILDPFHTTRQTNN